MRSVVSLQMRRGAAMGGVGVSGGTLDTDPDCLSSEARSGGAELQ